MINFLVQLIVAVIERLFKTAKPTMKEGAGAGPVEKRLRSKLKKDWQENNNDDATLPKKH